MCVISCSNKSCKEESVKSSLHELGQDEVPDGPKIKLLLLKGQLIAGAACAGGDAGKKDSRECRSIVLLTGEEGRWQGMQLIKRFRKRVDLF